MIRHRLGSATSEITVGIKRHCAIRIHRVQTISSLHCGERTIRRSLSSFNRVNSLRIIHRTQLQGAVHKRRIRRCRNRVIGQYRNDLIRIIGTHRRSVIDRIGWILHPRRIRGRRFLTKLVSNRIRQRRRRPHISRSRRKRHHARRINRIRTNPVNNDFGRRTIRRGLTGGTQHHTGFIQRRIRSSSVTVNQANNLLLTDKTRCGLAVGGWRGRISNSWCVRRRVRPAE